LRGTMSDTKTLSTVAANLGIGKLARHIFICADQTKPKCAEREASNEVWEHLKKRDQVRHITSEVLATFGVLQPKG